MTGPRIAIGKHYTPPPSMFSARTGTGGYRHVMPPMTADDERLQAALIYGPSKRCVGRIVAVVVGVAAAFVVMVLAS